MICTDYCLAGPKINKVSPMFFMTLLLTRAISKVCNEAHDDFVRRAQKRIPSGAADRPNWWPLRSGRGEASPRISRVSLKFQFCGFSFDLTEMPGNYC